MREIMSLRISNRDRMANHIDPSGLLRQSFRWGLRS